MINIAKPAYTWHGTLVPRCETTAVILHHAAMHGTPEEVHRLHVDNGWAGIGYHFYVRQNGIIYEGRPIETVGAHCKGHNARSIGVCFEGNFEREPEMCKAQLQAGQQLMQYIESKYPGISKYRHKDLYPTACPGAHFPFNEIINYTPPVPKSITSVNDILWELMDKSIVTDAEKWTQKMNEDKDVYWLCYKMANKLRGTLK